MLIIPNDYHSLLNLKDTQVAIKAAKDYFETNLARELHLTRVSAPLFVDPATGLNDDLNGVERPVEFDVKETGTKLQIVHSLAKWKRYALREYGFSVDEGLYTDMNAIRRDEDTDNIHSIYVDQWDWEKVIAKSDRTLSTLKQTVKKIYNVFKMTEKYINSLFPQLEPRLPEDVTFMTAQELEDMYPDLTPKEREPRAVKMNGAIFIMKIGDTLKSGEKHDGRAPDYDDWQLNGDIIFWNPTLGRQFEVSSMGIRVDAKSLAEQLAKAGCPERAELPFHKALLNNELPLTIGGGIGQSRLCMLLLHTAHIGEVQVSIWDDETVKACESAGIMLL